MNQGASEIEKKMEKKIESRIPRPRGCTMLARTGQIPELQNRIIEAYLDGQFPFLGLGLSYYEFSQLYNIPLQSLKKRLRNGALESIYEGDDMIETLNQERRGSLSSALLRIGTADQHTNNLIRHLVPRVLQDPRSHPLLVKEFNSAIGNQIRLTETQLKAISLLNDILRDIPQQALDVTSTVSREEVMAALAESAPLLIPEGAPNLDPISDTQTLKRSTLNREASHEFQDLKDQDRIPILSDIPVLPR